MPDDFAQDGQFCRLRRGEEIDLVGLLLEFAGDATPGIDTLACLAEIERLGRAAQRRLAARSLLPGCLAGLMEISRVLYEVEGFQGNRDDYYDPRNSLLDAVLSRRRGLPITLGILYIAVAERAGCAAYGVATPGHFFVGCETPGETLYVDPFGRGDVLSRCACRQRIEETLGRQGIVGDADFRRASSLEIAVRVLRNLKTAYAMRNDWPAMLPVQRRLALLLPDRPSERRDLGLIYLRTGQPRRALELLEEYQTGCEPPQDEELKPYLRAARQMAAELN